MTLDITIEDFTADRTAVVLVDMQPICLGPEGRKIIPAQVEVLRICKRREIPVAVLEIAEQRQTVRELKRILRGYKHQALVYKNGTSGFDETNLELVLRKWERECLFLMGVHSCSCVYRTGRDGKAKGFRIATSKDVIAPIDAYVIKHCKEMGLYLYSYRELPAFS